MIADSFTSGCSVSSFSEMGSFVEFSMKLKLQLRARGFEFVTFDVSLLPIIWKKQSSNWEALALGYVNDIISLVHSITVALKAFDESVDAILCHNREAEALLNKAEEKMSDLCLVELVNQGVLSLLEEELKAVEGTMAKVEQSMLETRKMIDAVSVSKVEQSMLETRKMIDAISVSKVKSDLGEHIQICRPPRLLAHASNTAPCCPRFAGTQSMSGSLAKRLRGVPGLP